MTANRAHSGRNLRSMMFVRVLRRNNCNSRCKFFKVTCKSYNSHLQVSVSHVNRKKSQDDDRQQGTQWEKSTMSVRVLRRNNCNSRCKFFKVPCKSYDSHLKVRVNHVNRKKAKMMTANRAHSGKNLRSAMSLRVLGRNNFNSRCKYFKVTCKSCNSHLKVSASQMNKKKKPRWWHPKEHTVGKI